MKGGLKTLVILATTEEAARERGREGELTHRRGQSGGNVREMKMKPSQCDL